MDKIKEKVNVNGSMSLAQNPYIKKGFYHQDFSLQIKRENLLKND